MKKGVWKKVGKDEYRTRLHKDACVFLNRPDFAAGPGCALHLHALNTGKHFSETKPTVCWQLPLRAVEREEEDESTTTVLTEFGRDGWGEGGEEFGWWCTEAKEAFTGAEPVYKSMEAELRAMLGDDVYEQVVKYLDSRLASGAAPVPHPAEVPVTMGRTRAPEAVTAPTPAPRATVDDLAAEQRALQTVVRALDPDEWLRPTPGAWMGRARHDLASRGHRRNGDRHHARRSRVAQRGRRPLGVGRRHHVSGCAARPAPAGSGRPRVVRAHLGARAGGDRGSRPRHAACRGASE